MTRPLFASALAVLISTFSVSAFADADEQAACEGKEENASCRQNDDDYGKCVFDDGETFLSCNDDGVDQEAAACEGIAENENCTQPDGDPGKCVFDEGETFLSCEDDDVDPDRVACEGKTEGASCTEYDGDAGECVVGRNDILECEDDGLAPSGSNSDGCTTAPGLTAAGAATVPAGLMLAALVLARRRRGPRAER